MKRIILASASPRRRELLSRIVENFEIIPAKGEEKARGGLTPEETACALAEAKCDEVFENNADAMVIASDTIVVFDGRILGKPKSAEEARETLKVLSGNGHRVITGVCVRARNIKKVDYDVTEVRFCELSDEFISAYVASGSPMDKAGSYGIQDGGVVKDYSGSYTNVVGLPVELLKRMLKEVL